MLQDARPSRRLIIAALWFGATLCYAYGDIVGFYEPGAVQRLLNGKMGFWDVNPGLLLGIAVFMSVPPILAVLTLLLPASLSRWLNMVFGVLFSAVMIFTMINAFKFGLFYYLYFGVVEVGMTAGIVAYAFTWPKQATL